jgi:hypothetical protein
MGQTCSTYGVLCAGRVCTFIQQLVAVSNSTVTLLTCLAMDSCANELLQAEAVASMAQQAAKRQRVAAAAQLELEASKGVRSLVNRARQALALLQVAWQGREAWSSMGAWLACMCDYAK